MAEEYHTPEPNPSPCCPEHQSVSHDTSISAAEKVALTIDLADLLCGPAGNGSGLRQIGDKWIARCPLPDCTSQLSSFAVWPGTDTWHCYSCLRGGGAIDLALLIADEPAT